MPQEEEAKQGENVENVEAQNADAQLEGREGAEASQETDVVESGEVKQEVEINADPSRHKLPAHLTPEEREAREKEIAEEAANFTPENFPADKPDEDLENNQYYIFTARLVLRLPKDVSMDTFLDAETQKFLQGDKTAFIHKFLNEVVIREVTKEESEAKLDTVIIPVPRDILSTVKEAGNDVLYCDTAVVDGQERRVEIHAV
jgi:hypothetical protein